jgi:hypothetical protein
MRGQHFPGRNGVTTGCDVTEASIPAEIASADERLCRLYRYWNGRRGGRRFPSRDDVDPLDFPYALGRVSLIEVERDPLRFRFRLVSTGLTEHLGYEMTGKYVDDLPEPSMREFTRAFYERALDRHAPLHEASTVLIERYTWQYEVLVLPLASDGETVDMLMIYRRTERPAAASVGERPR